VNTETWLAIGALLLGGQGIGFMFTWRMAKRQSVSTVNLNDAQAHKLTVETSNMVLQRISEERDDCHRIVKASVRYIDQLSGDIRAAGIPVRPKPDELLGVIL
jgi:hypothetical protein